jgi:hypothetical protein
MIDVPPSSAAQFLPVILVFLEVLLEQWQQL